MKRCRRAVRLLLVMLCPATALSAQRAPRAEEADAARERGGPELRWPREMALASAGAGLLIVGHFVASDPTDVPSVGLDPAEIGWGPDRGVVGRTSVGADRASNWMRNAALAFPAMLMAMSPLEDGWGGLRARGLAYAETLLASQGMTLLGKNVLRRARPYAYLSEAERPTDPAFDVTSARTFRSMPSGHASSAWTGASMGITEHLLSRPEASWAERAAVGFVGGGLAGATSSLRVEAGQHFPSDVLAGAGIGLVTGVAVPLLHRGRRAMPSTAAWLEALGGTVAGTLTGILVTR